MHHNYSFALLAHASDIVDFMRIIMRNRSDKMRYEYVDFEIGPSLARACLASGCDAVICHGGTGNVILREVGHSVVVIDRTDMDVIKTLRRAKHLADHVVLAGYRQEMYDTEAIEDLLSMRIYHIPYETDDELLHEIRKAYDKGVKVLVGGGVSKRYMEQLGGVGFVIRPSLHNVHMALEQARIIARRKREEKMHNEDIMLIFTQLQEGVVCIDQDKNLVFANPKSYQILKVPSNEGGESLAPFFASLGLKDVLRTQTPFPDKVADIAGETFVVRTLPLLMHGGKRCAVAFFRDASSHQKTSRKIGEHLYSQGFVAKAGLSHIVGQSAPITRVKEKILRFARSDASVLITGETGTGKELAAHALHSESLRKGRPFVAVNCASFSPSLLESELFGYEDGAFTGAKRGGKMGLFETAEQGTILLDEIGEISPELQLLLLRVLEAKEFMRVGGKRLYPVNVRVLSASHRALLDLVRERRFRQDLYYRITTLKLTLPPLRERLEDIPLIVAQKLQNHNMPPEVISPTIYKIINSYSWPGNIRELLSLMESYIILLEDNKADNKLFESLFHEMYSFGTSSEVCAISLDGMKSLKENLNDCRLHFIQQAVESCGGDKQRAANKLGISQTTLWRILHGLKSADDGGRTNKICNMFVT